MNREFVLLTGTFLLGLTVSLSSCPTVAKSQSRSRIPESILREEIRNTARFGKTQLSIPKRVSRNEAPGTSPWQAGTERDRYDQNGKERDRQGQNGTDQDRQGQDGAERETALLNDNRKTLESCCEKLMNAKRSIYYLNTRSYKMCLQLSGIYTREEAIFFCLRLYNHSHIDYGIDSIRFYTTDEKELKSTPVQETPLFPLYNCGNARIIKGKTREFCVFALPRFTLPKGKLLVVEVLEKNGGRNLRLQTSNFTLVRARLI